MQGKLHTAFLELLKRQGIEAIDLLPVFRKTDEVDLYATDCHSWKPGHAMLAEALLPRLVELLAN